MAALSQLEPETRAGERLVAHAEALATRLAETAQEHDAAGRYPMENVGLLQQAGYFTASIPEQFGGQGVESMFDILVASSRLARGDASTTIGLNMHLVVVSNMVHRWRIAWHRGQARRAEAFASSLERIVNEGTIIAAAVSEPGQNLTRPATEAVPSGSGWVLNGRKIFCTMSPAASVLLASTTYSRRDDELLYGYAEVPVETPGVTIHDDWDSLGMRSSGSNSVSFRDVYLPESALRGGFPIGSATGYIERNLSNGLFHASASLGIAEAAFDSSVRRLTARSNRQLGAAEQMLVAENAIAVSAMRASFARAAHLVDDFQCAHLTVDATPDELCSVFAEVQAAKTFVTGSAAEIVDRAMTLSGGAGYMRAHPLSRAYRDVRAAGFMQPLGYARAYEYLAQALLGLEVSLT
jgi:alkylation response protein AidB-like acyl-CoA dehydrogenase